MKKKRWEKVNRKHLSVHKSVCRDVKTALRLLVNAPITRMIEKENRELLSMSF